MIKNKKVKKKVFKMNIAFKIIKAIVVYGLCLYYNTKVLLGLLLLFITKFDTKFWRVKERPVPPKCLLDKEYGEHKYLTVNVSFLFVCLKILQTLVIFINNIFFLNINYFETLKI